MFSERMYSLSQAAKIIGCSYSCILKWRKKGKLNGVQTFEIGNSIVVAMPSSSVERLRDEFQKRKAERGGK